MISPEVLCRYPFFSKVSDTALKSVAKKWRTHYSNASSRIEFNWLHAKDVTKFTSGRCHLFFDNTRSVTILGYSIQ